MLKDLLKKSSAFLCLLVCKYQEKNTTVKSDVFSMKFLSHCRFLSGKWYLILKNLPTNSPSVAAKFTTEEIWK